MGPKALERTARCRRDAVSSEVFHCENLTLHNWQLVKLRNRDQLINKSQFKMCQQNYNRKRPVPLSTAVT